MVFLSERERISILMMKGWGDNQRSLEAVQVLFNETFLDRNEPISKNTVKRMIDRFNETSTVIDLPRSGRPATTTNEENQLNVALSVIEDPHSTVRKLHQQHNLSVGSIHNI